MISGHIKMKNQINEIGNEVIDLQIKALKKLKSSINPSFNDAVKTITNCKSKVILCGVGKSGKIASKISATFSSVGVPSFSISSNDCSNGDLGIITNISYAHSKNFKNIKEIANAKAEIINNIKKNGSIVLNMDDDFIIIKKNFNLKKN